MIKRTKEELHEMLKNHLKEVDYTKKKMFGGLAFFINRNMFTGTHQSDLFMRLSSEDRQEALIQDGISVFEPRKGMVMGEYVVLTESVLENESVMKKLLKKSISYVSSLPLKEPMKKRKK
ncbi:MAG: TfoX/Sxy family protein [Candidatus Thorarchaeota archaeon]|jgi:TfoX/Sxy family transcriptional regulator of competence genes